MTEKEPRSYYLPPPVDRDLGPVTARKAAGEGNENTVIVDLGGTAGELWVKSPGVARQLLVAAVEALRILEPVSAQEAVAKLVTDLLDTAFPADPGLEGMIRAGQAIDATLSLIADCGAAQPADIPIDLASCTRCGAAEGDVPLMLSRDGLVCHNTGSCGRRAAARARIAGPS